MNTQTTDSNNDNIQKGDNVYSYNVIRAEYLEELSAWFYEFEHLPTGARHIHLGNDDSENTFSVAFKTVPDDSTGVAHILEHTALCGSEKFPVRDPFFSMIKRSLNTFMNAFTASDWTMYPFSTQNRKDYRNLLDVYLDAAFFPKLDALSFKQEGHRLEFEKSDTDNTEKLVYKGVVYNEMKGAMSSQSQVMGRAMLNALYPTTTYGWNSGGDPEVIPHLDLAQLVDFHKKHYHPSNAWFYTYGDIPIKETLLFIEEKVLSKYSRTDPGTDVPNETRWNEPEVKRYYYPLDSSDSSEKKCQVSVGWLTADIKDSFEVLVLVLLNHILLGNAASPLRKALIDSELGASLCDATGFDADNRDTMFACGLKGVEEGDADKILSIVLDTINDLAENGIEKELIETAIHQIEFRQKEVTNSPYPYGIKCLLRMSGCWFHGGDVANALQLNAELKQLDAELAKGGFFEKKLKEYFIDNTHRVQLILCPDTELEAKRSQAVRAELDEIEAKLTQVDKDEINNGAETLEKLQESEEDLTCLPTLSIDDIPPDIKSIQKNKGYDTLPASCYCQPTSGIFYFSSASGLSNLSEDLLPLIPFFCISFTKVGTQKRDYSSLARLISSATGGIGMAAHARTGFDGSGKCRPFISLGGKCLNRNQDRLFDIIFECTHAYDFSNVDRIRSLLLEYKSGLESSIVQNGYALAISNSVQHFSNACGLNEIWNGIQQVRYIKKLADRLDEEPDRTLSEIQAGFSTIAEGLFDHKNFRYALIGEEQMFKSAEAGLSLIGDIAAPESSSLIPELKLANSFNGGGDLRRGWTTNSAVSFVGASLKTVPMGHDDAPGLAVISKLLRSNYLHREIREKGGAYGGFSMYNSEDGTFSFGSYRDPHVCRTINVFEDAGSFLNSGNFTENDITESILQLASVIDKPDTPATASKKAFYRDILSLTDEMRLAYKQRLLATGKEEILRLSAKYFDRNADEMSVSVISGAEKLESANEKLGAKGLEIKRI